MLKKIFATILIGVVALSSTTVFAENVSDKFTDLDEQSPYYDDICYAVDTGIFTGTSETKFSPDVQLTRGMFVTLLGRIYQNLYGDENAPEKEVTETGFSDVAVSDYYAPYIKWALENKIISGYTENVFAPNDILTKEQALTILYRFAEFTDTKVDAGADTNILSYNDSFDISGYAIPAIQWALGFDIISSDGNVIEPQHKVTRAETASFLSRFVSGWFNNRQDREVTEE